LTRKHFVFDLLKIEKADGLLLKFVDCCIATFGRWFKQRYGRRLQGKCVVQFR